MSWSVSKSAVPYDKVSDVLNAANAETTAQHPESEDQISAAMLIVKDLIDKGVVGNTTRKFNFTLSGHANPNHAPKPGWANDAISINVSQAYEE